MKILIVSIFRLESFPPIISLIHDLLDLGYNVSIIVNGISKENKLILENKGVKVFATNISLRLFSMKNVKSFDKQNTFSRIYYSKTLYKTRKIIVKIIHRILYLQLTKKFIKKIKELKCDYIWFSDIDTANYFKNKVNNSRYIVSIQELISNKKYKKFLQNAAKLIVPEETRSAIIRSNYNLKTFPVVLPNKPYEFEIKAMEYKKYSLPEEINDRKIVLYQGLFGAERNLIQFVDAIKEMKEKFVLLLQIIFNSDKEQYDYISNIENVFIIPTLPAPQHLLITQKAYIGLVTYHHKNLNCEFCAPNKIFEYSKFGLPILANDVTGLLNSVGKYNAGICLNLEDTSVQDIKKTILKIDKNYKYYSENSKKLYESVDRKKILKEAFKDL